VKKTCTIALLLLFSYFGFSQNKIAKGYVLDEQSRAPIDSAIVAVYDTAIYTYADVTGYFSLQIPKRRRHLDITHRNYQSKRIMLAPGFQHRNTKVYLKSNRVREVETKIQHEKDSSFLSFKNAISLSLVELLSVAIAVRYERFLSLKQSLGIHSSFYIYGFKPNMGSEYELYVNYNGIKVAPFYRFYPIRKANVGLFLEGKIPFGYFNFNDYEYHRHSSDNQKLSYEYSFRTWGFGISLGVMLKGQGLPRSDPYKSRLVFNFSIGYQYFPMVEPPEKIYREVSIGTPHQTTLTYKTSTGWWHETGPGSYFDLKITIGGIF